jgi:hypothetical protein
MTLSYAVFIWELRLRRNVAATSTVRIASTHAVHAIPVTAENPRTHGAKKVTMATMPGALRMGERRASRVAAARIPDRKSKMPNTYALTVATRFEVAPKTNGETKRRTPNNMVA